jgi:hypothetical protein
MSPPAPDAATLNASLNQAALQIPSDAGLGLLLALSQAQDLDAANTISPYNKGEQGVYAEYPFSTPKYAKNKGLRDNEFKETLARFYISLAGGSANAPGAIVNYLASVPDQAKPLAKVLVGSNTTNGGTGFIDFFLTQINETFAEVAQVEKVLSDNYVAFFFGSEPPVFQYSGMLLNSVQDDQRIGMAIAYQHLIRGTQLARRGALLRVRYDDVIVSGTVMNMSQVLNADNELAVPFNFSLLVKEYLIIKVPSQVTTKVETAFVLPENAQQVGSASNIRSKTLLAPTKLSSTSVAGDDQDASAAETLADKVTNAGSALDGAVSTPSDIRPGTAPATTAPASQ